MTELNSPGPVVEEWRPVPTFPHIEASSLGRIRYVGPERRKMKTGHVFPQHNDKGGYLTVGVPLLDSSPLRRKTMRVHRLVALAFHGLPPEWAELVEHRDDCKTNNTADNLFWSTNRANLNRPGFIAKQRARRGEKNSFYGRKHSPEARARISAARISAAKRGEKNPFHGRQHSPETREKMREAAARRWLRAATATAAVEPIFARETVAATSGHPDPETLEIGLHRLPGNAAHA